MPPKPRKPRKPPPVLKPETWFFEEKTMTSVGDTRYWHRLGITSIIVIFLCVSLLMLYHAVPVDPPPEVWAAGRAAATRVAVEQVAIAHMSGIVYEVIIIGLDSKGLPEVASVRVAKDGAVLSETRILSGDPRPVKQVMLWLSACGLAASLWAAWRFRRDVVAALRGPRVEPPNLP